MIPYAPTFFHVSQVATDGGTIPVELLAGPYGFLGVIFTCAFWGLREWRKGRELDVANYRRRAEEAETRADTLEEKNNTETAVLTAKIEGLQGDIRALRDQHFREQEVTSAKYYAARQMLLSVGIPKEEIP